MNAYPCVDKVNFSQCAFGLVSVEGAPMRKLTTIMSNSRIVLDKFRDVKCTCQVPHKTVEGARVTARATIYPHATCVALADAVYPQCSAAQ